MLEAFLHNNSRSNNRHERQEKSNASELATLNAALFLKGTTKLLVTAETQHTYDLVAGKSDSQKPPASHRGR
jgi:hypothetical protein